MSRLLSHLAPQGNNFPKTPQDSSHDAYRETLTQTSTTIWKSLAQFGTKLAFWTAISLPVLYLPLLLAGLDTTMDLLVFLGLFSMHVLMLLAGRTHRSGAPS